MTIRKLFSGHSTTKAHTNSQWLQWYAQDLFKLNIDKIPAWSGGQMNTLIHPYLKIPCYLVDLGERWPFFFKGMAAMHMK